jgi:enoyl-[acyl-carrier protein] reductase II
VILVYTSKRSVLGPVRMVRNKFGLQVDEAEKQGADAVELRNLPDKGHSRTGIFEGDFDDGELKIGQVSALVNEIKPARIILEDIIREYIEIRDSMPNKKYPF